MKKLISKGFLARKVLAVLMIMMLVVSVIAPNIAWAEETSTTTHASESKKMKQELKRANQMKHMKIVC